MDENENKHEDETGNIPADSRRSINPLWFAVIVFLCVAAVGVGFIVEQHKAASQLSARNQVLTSTLTQTRGQLQTLTAKLDTLQTEQKEQQQAQAERERVEKAAAIRREAAIRRQRRYREIAAKKAAKKDDPRWKQVESELAQHQKDIAATKQDLANTQSQFQNSLNSTRDQLSGSIAKTHAELVALERKGERTYYEFDMFKSRRFHRVGPIEVSLRRTNNKHKFCKLMLIVNDRTLTQKHVNLYEPLFFYTQKSGPPMELVINEINKRHMHGYLSVPKDQGNQTSAMNMNTGSMASPGAGTANASMASNASVAAAQPAVVDLRHHAAPTGN